MGEVVTRWDVIFIVEPWVLETVKVSQQSRPKLA